MDKNIIIIGAGTYGEVINELAQQLGYSVVAFYDDDENKIGNEIDGVKVIGKINIEDINCTEKNFAVAIGNNKIRKSISEKIQKKGGYLPNLIHPNAILSPSVIIGCGCFIHANTYIWTKAKISSFTIISPNTLIAHHTELGEANFVSSGANIGANIFFEEGVFVGIGATIMTGVNNLGAYCLIGAGSTVIKNVLSNETVAGVPAKTIKKS